MAELIYPTSSQLTTIAQDKLPRLEKDRLGLKLLPIVTSDTSLIIWEQKDNYKGLQQVRGLGGQPPRVAAIGSNQFQMRPGVYGEYQPVDEVQLTERRKFGTIDTPIDIRDLTMEAQDLLLLRRLDRQEANVWELLVNGTFSVYLPGGGLGHTDSYPVQEVESLSDWTDHENSTPLADLRRFRLLGRNSSSKFNATATIYVSQVTADHMLANTNPDDLGGKRVNGQSTLLSLEQVNLVFSAEGLPRVEVYDEGYEDTDGYHLYIPDLKLVAIGRRTDGSPIGKYVMTRNVNNPGMAPGAYMKVIVKDDEVPLVVEIHDGHNGGPIIEYPSAVAIGDVSGS